MSLDPFTEGYASAIRAAHPEIGDAPFAPETLARIIGDCAAFNARIGDASHNQGIGATFWKSRQIGFSAHWSLHQTEMAAAFPPLTITLRDGKVVFA